MNSNKLWRKIKHFIKRNSYAIAVSVCVVIAITLISVTAITFNKGAETGIDQEVNTKPEDTDIPEIPVDSEEIISFVLPIENGTISKEYAEDHLLEDKTTGFWQAHMAIDFSATEGSKVLSVYDGTVEKIENSMMDGLVITIKHSDTLKTVYKCLGDEALVSEGDKVKAGQEIGTVSTNLTEKADGIHLHFELYENDKIVDPTPYFEMGK